MGWDIGQHFLYQAAKSDSLQELKSRTAQLLPPAIQEELFGILTDLDPVYSSLVWKPSQAKLTRYSKKLKRIWKSGRLSAAFSDTLRFYRSSWSREPHFTIHLVPIPAGRAPTTATVIQDAVILEALLNERDLAARAGVIFHEMAHAAFEAQDPHTQHQLDTWFKESPSRFAGLAYNLLNEGLATALGNGWAFRLITGKEDDSGWYSVDEIDRGAKAATTLVREYVSNRKPIDRSFVERWIESYTRTFPNAFNRTDILLRQSILISDGKNISSEDARAEFKKSIRVNSLYWGSPIADNETLKMIREAPGSSALIVVASPDQLDEIHRLAQEFPGLKPGIESIQSSPESIGAAYTSGERAYVVLRTNGKSDLNAAFRALSKLSELRDSVQMIRF